MVGGRGHSDFLSFLWGKIMKIRDRMGYRGLLFSAASSQGLHFVINKILLYTHQILLSICGVFCLAIVVLKKEKRSGGPLPWVVLDHLSLPLGLGAARSQLGPLSLTFGPCPAPLDHQLHHS